MRTQFRAALTTLLAAGGILWGSAALAAFPAPYCVRGYASNVEPITLVEIDGIENVTPGALNGSPANEDFTAIVGELAPGASYIIKVQGNTDGNFRNAIAVYFDWDQDGSFSASEGYFIGVLENSTGADGKTVSASIPVPSTASLGQTRMRVTKQYTSSASPTIEDAKACGTSGFGQAEDYTIDIDPNAFIAPDLALAISPSSAQVGAPVSLTVMLGNSSPESSWLTDDFRVTLPDGLTFSNMHADCHGTIVADDGSDVLLFEYDGAIPPGGCIITADVTASAGGQFEIQTGTLYTHQGNADPVSIGFLATQGDAEVTYATDFEEFPLGPVDGQAGWIARYFNVVSDEPRADESMRSGKFVQGLSKSSPTSENTPMIRSPWFCCFWRSMEPEASETLYMSVAANLRISRNISGASWQLEPEDPDTSRITTRVQFDRSAERKIRAVKFDAGGEITPVDTGAQWPVDTDFRFKVIVNRGNGALKLCMDDTEIYSDASGAGTLARSIKQLTMAQVVGPGQTENNTFDIDDLEAESTPYGSCDGLAVAVEVAASVGTGSGSIVPGGVQSFQEGDTPSFSLLPTGGHQIVNVVGTCSGFLVDNTFTTYPLAGNCTIVANFGPGGELPDDIFANGFDS